MVAAQKIPAAQAIRPPAAKPLVNAAENGRSLAISRPSRKKPAQRRAVSSTTRRRARRYALTLTVVLILLGTSSISFEKNDSWNGIQEYHPGIWGAKDWKWNDERSSANIVGYVAESAAPEWLASLRVSQRIEFYKMGRLRCE